MSAANAPTPSDGPARADAAGPHGGLPHYDAVVVGAGWAGLYALIRLRELGLRAIAFEAGSGVGGTWFWNRYPGARCDVRSVNYSFSFSTELEQEWTWTERYAAQPEIERYANHVADRFGLRPDIRLNARVRAAHYDETTRRWVVRTGTEAVTATYCIMAAGAYSQPLEPDIPGVGEFRGESFLTARWPQHEVSYDGKRVGVIGTGASGMQTVTAIAAEPVGHLYVFQRTANFAVPAQNGPLDPGYVAELKANYPQFRERARWSGSGTVYEGPSGPVADLPDKEFAARMDAGWTAGGTSVCGGVTDLMSDRRANDRVAAYIRERIFDQVRDRSVAEVLGPRGYTLGARRVLVETTYFEAFNQPNVTLVDVRADPIQRVTGTGLETARSRYDLDMIIYATGFDSGTGAALRIDIRGRGGERLSEHWADGPRTYLGIMVSGFPDMFFIAGPGSPSIRSNVLVSIEQHVDWIGDFLAHLREHAVIAAEPSPEAEARWTAYVDSLVDKSLLAGDDTQYFGSNVPGKPRAYLAYIGGVGNYRKICNDVRDSGYEGMVLTSSGADGPSDLTASREWSGPHLDGSMRSRFGSTVI